jgi:hypothetical protein
MESKQKTTREIIEDVLDEFDFIKCHDLESNKCKEISGHHTTKRIRDLKNEAEKAINVAIEQIEDLEKQGKSKFNVLSHSMVNSFLCIVYYAEPIEIQGFHYPEGYRIQLSYSELVLDHMTY